MTDQNSGTCFYRSDSVSLQESKDLMENGDVFLSGPDPNSRNIIRSTR